MPNTRLAGAFSTAPTFTKSLTLFICFVATTLFQPGVGLANGGITVKQRTFAKGDGTLFLPRGIFIREANFKNEEQFKRRWGLTPKELIKTFAAAGGNTLRVLPTVDENGKEVVAKPELNTVHASTIKSNFATLLDLCESHDVKVVIAPTAKSTDGKWKRDGGWYNYSFGEFKDWPSHPYHKANGGVLEDITDIVINEEAKALFTKRINFYLQFAEHPALMGLDIEDSEFSDGARDWKKRDKRFQCLVDWGKRAQSKGLQFGITSTRINGRNMRETKGYDWLRYQPGDGWFWPQLIGNRLTDKDQLFYKKGTTPLWTCDPKLDLLMKRNHLYDGKREATSLNPYARALSGLVSYTKDLHVGQQDLAKQFTVACDQLTAIKPIALAMETGTWQSPKTTAQRGALGIQTGDITHTVALVESTGTTHLPLLNLSTSTSHHVTVIGLTTGKIHHQGKLTLGDIPQVSLPSEPSLVYATSQEIK